ncbi:60s ribosomal protein l7, precursor [Trichosporon asahii var. asahii CBS 2479]|uniref:60s ribosomal protein l7 n=1 Tax=Trichosporon asahii var. asahii (strain ATCC 90039 / CBS 2479 / JCM 2466 / KCTC 7840 / NBRC 103889/ NCYC 2677 / UAMH 7654) TaxID=1186058 RepID=J4U9J0_TRIAS|nr:60s ribosomal protein l7, precursor [Trichosporon asahii var. asahii CBS 2479]EJT47305.1 60s ribosomal protein l7, precursor [Trichosporon asahii var. asahii CBS 2479]
MTQLAGEHDRRETGRDFAAPGARRCGQLDLLLISIDHLVVTPHLDHVAAASASRVLRPSAPSVLIPARHASSSTKTQDTAADDWVVPAIHLGPTHPSRYGEHYAQTLETDMMYMAYNHRANQVYAAEARKAADKAAQPAPMLTGYEANRPKAMPRGNRPERPLNRPITPELIPALESITIHSMVKEAIGTKQALLDAIMALRTVSGESQKGAGRMNEGVQVLRARKSAAAWKLRQGMPISTKVEIKGEPMYDFLQSFVEFVLPRLRDYPGFKLPGVSSNKNTPSAISGVVAMGLPPAAMGLFPQIENSIDSYPRLHGFDIVFKTNLRGADSQEFARALLSGFRIPFSRN